MTEEADAAPPAPDTKYDRFRDGPPLAGYTGHIPERYRQQQSEGGNEARGSSGPPLSGYTGKAGDQGSTGPETDTDKFREGPPLAGYTGRVPERFRQGGEGGANSQGSSGPPLLGYTGHRRNNSNAAGQEADSGPPVDNSVAEEDKKYRSAAPPLAGYTGHIASSKRIETIVHNEKLDQKKVHQQLDDKTAYYRSLPASPGYTGHIPNDSEKKVIDEKRIAEGEPPAV